MARILIANLPETSEINPQSFVIIERPGIGSGTYKSTVGDLQRAITVKATVTQEDNITTITVTDINGTTQEQIFTPLATVDQVDKLTTIRITDLHGTTEETILTPTAKIVDNGDNTATITITDTEGTTEDTIVSRLILDDRPTEGSSNFLTSGTIYVSVVELEQEIADAEQRLSDKIDEVDTNLNDKIDQVNADLNERIDDVVVDVDDRIQAVEDRVTALEERMGLVENRLDAAEGRLDSAESRLTDGEDRITSLEFRMEDAETALERTLMIEDSSELDEPFKVNGVTYDDLEDAMLAAIESRNKTVKLMSNAHNKGIALPENSELTLDLNGYTLNMTGPGSGSPGTKTLGMQLLKGSTVTIKNGEIKFEDDRLKMGIQNYCNLTLDGVSVFGGPTIQYVVSNNFGNVEFKNNTSITPTGNNVAFDVWYGMAAVYDDGVNVTIADNSVRVNGKVEFGKANRASAELFSQRASIVCPQSMVLNLSLLNTPCEWSDNGGGTKILRYIYTP